jgi:DnaK suppressor protein
MRKSAAAAAPLRGSANNRSVAVRPAPKSTVTKKSSPAPAARPTKGAAAVKPASRLRLVRPPGPPVARALAPPAPALTAQQLANPFRGLLLTRRQELTGNLEETKFDTLAKMGRVAEDDQAQMSHEEFISVQRNSMDYNALRQVNAALERINTGDFGICASCDEPISEKRLKAIPWAKYCVVCQDRVQANGVLEPAEPEDGPPEGW